MKLKTEWEKLKVRKKLIDAFKSGKIHLTYKIADNERLIFPKIHAVEIAKEFTTITFTLPNGLNPDLLEKNFFAFQQHFGNEIELEGEYKKFVLKIYNASIPSELIYNYKSIKNVIDSYRLGGICGKNRQGEYVAFDLLKQPHILIAGETGSGKSTQLRSILTTMILSKRPEDLELYLGDCKKSEFHIFRKVEHVQYVHSSPRDIQKMLLNIKKELDVRSDLTETFEVSHVDELPAEHKRPYMVVCIDEFVMLRKDEKIMDILTEIAAIGRTLGVFLMLSMQRPNAKVLDTTIRANLTVSMGFKLRDAMESKIVNTPLTHKIETSGRYIMNSDKLYDIQAPYLTMEKAKKLLNQFMVAKGPVKEVKEDPPQITEKDVFNDVN
ncbi:FtsK/SpoIIIE domain-containing protein [Cytobacillus firmus]|uniref:FtsK/SpoIIIE domain-containing protein n=1 Tax=Cytobacillus firmus TaxID=1399 RepID=UPI001C8DDD66|nr:FtsK/SpoIIIE domain-containing protein [Cytobacillus firmus]MBX9972552.1 DNA translocase FtsK [Cytobacillus firmus]